MAKDMVFEDDCRIAKKSAEFLGRSPTRRRIEHFVAGRLCSTRHGEGKRRAIVVELPNETTVSNRAVEWREFPTPKCYDEPSGSGARLPGVHPEPSHGRSDSRERLRRGVGTVVGPVGITNYCYVHLFLASVISLYRPLAVLNRREGNEWRNGS
jgi:hypothetical protein